MLSKGSTITGADFNTLVSEVRNKTLIDTVALGLEHDTNNCDAWNASGNVGEPHPLYNTSELMEKVEDSNHVCVLSWVKLDSDPNNLLHSLKTEKNTFTGEVTDQLAQSMLGDEEASAENLAHIDCPGTNDGKGDPHFPDGPPMPGSSLTTESHQRNRQMLLKLCKTSTFGVTSLSLHGSENCLNFEKLRRETDELKCLDVTKLFMTALNTPSGLLRSVGTVLKVWLVKSSERSIVVYTVPSQCWGRMLQTKGIGGDGQDLAMRISYFLVAQCHRLMRGDITRIENFEGSSLYANRISSSAAVGSSFDALYAALGGFPRDLWNMLKGTKERRNFELKDMRWIIHIVRKWCGEDLAQTNVAIGLHDSVVTTAKAHLHAVDFAARVQVLHAVRALEKVYQKLNWLETRIASGKLSQEDVEYVQAGLSAAVVTIGGARYEKNLCLQSMGGTKGGTKGGTEAQRTFDEHAMEYNSKHPDDPNVTGSEILLAGGIPALKLEPQQIIRLARERRSEGGTEAQRTFDEHAMEYNSKHPDDPNVTGIEILLAGGIPALKLEPQQIIVLARERRSEGGTKGVKGNSKGRGKYQLSGQNNKNGRKNTSPCGEFEQFTASQKGVTIKQIFSATFPEHLSACAECQNLLKTEYDKCCTGKNEEYVQPRQRERTTRNPHYVFHKYYKKYLNSGSKQNKN